VRHLEGVGTVPPLLGGVPDSPGRRSLRILVGYLHPGVVSDDCQITLSVGLAVALSPLSFAGRRRSIDMSGSRATVRLARARSYPGGTPSC
jgi:hypothetical protein